MKDTILFHGSTKIIEHPKLGVGNPKNDYGLGFYCTEHLDLAKEWACTDNLNGFANKYALDETGLRILHLNAPNFHILNWLAILLENRTFVIADGLPNEARDYLLKIFLPEYQSYDVIIGYRADDSYFAFANAFINNTISLEQLSHAMHLGNLGEQFVLKSERAFQRLTYLESIPAEQGLYYPKRMARDRQARQDFQKIKSTVHTSEQTFMIDILRQKWNNDDPRLF